MVPWGIMYEAPSYLPLPPFSARPPFYSLCLCSAHTSVLPHRLSPSQFPSSLCSLLPSPSPLVCFTASPPVPLSIFSQSLFAHVHIHHLLSSCCLLYPHLSASPYIFSRSSHSFNPISLSYTLSSTHIKEVVLLFIHREQNHLKLFIEALAEVKANFLK